MIYSTAEYAKVYGYSNQKAVIRRIEKGLLPTGHTAHKVSRFHIIEVQTTYLTKRSLHRADRNNV